MKAAELKAKEVIGYSLITDKIISLSTRRDMSKKVKRKLFDQPQEVINRWFAIKAIRITRPYTELPYLFRLRVTLKRDARKRNILWEVTFNIILKKTRDYLHTKLSAPKQLYNIV